MHRPINVLHLIGSLSIGGAQRLILGLGRHGRRTGIDVHLFGFGTFRKESFVNDFKNLGISMRLRSTRRFYDPCIPLAICGYIRSRRIDLVHTHLAYADIIGRAVGRIVGVPVLSTLHNDPRNYRDQRFDRRFLTLFTTRRMTDGLVAVSHHIRRRFIEQWRLPEKKIDAIYNAVELDHFLDIPAPSPAAAPDSGSVVTNIASLSPQKAQDQLLAAARIVLKRYPESRFRIVGRGDLEADLKRIASELGISRQVDFTGVRHDIPDILARSDIFVLSSLWEGLPLAAIEAMAAARPVVLTDVGGNRELAVSGVHGLLVPPGDVGALANAILALMDNPERRAVLGRAARERVCRAFNMETVADRYAALYRNLVDHRRRHRGRNARRPS